MKYGLLTILIVALLGVGAYLLAGFDQNAAADRNTKAATSTNQAAEHDHDHSDIPSGWSTYTSTDVGLTFHHPSMTDISENTKRNFVKLQIIGPDQEPNTEVTDGFTMWMRHLRREQATSRLKEVAQDVFERKTRHGEVVAKLATSSVASRAAYTFANTTALGNTVHHTLWRVPGNSYVYITYSVSSPDADRAAAYQRAIERIIAATDPTMS